MSLNNPKSGGPNHVGEYQLSGIPYARQGTVANLCGAAIAVNVDPRDGQTTNANMRSFAFPRVTRWIYVKNTSADAAHTVRIHFSELSAAADAHADIAGEVVNTAHKAIVLAGGADTVVRLPLRLTKIYFPDGDNGRTIQVIAGLTSVEKESFTGHIEHFTDNN